MTHFFRSWLPRHQTLALIAIVVIGMGLRIALMVPALHHAPELLQSPDSPGYLAVASAVKQHGTFSHAPDTPEIPETLRTPGYPLFIALAQCVLGYPLGSILFAQAILAAAVTLIMFALARRFLPAGHPATWAAPLLFLLDGTSTASSLMVLSDFLFGVLLLVSVYCFSVSFENNRKLWCLWGASAFAAATMVRPIAYYFILPLAAIVGWHFIRSTRCRRTAVLALLLVLLPFVVTVGGWQVRNYVTTGSSAFSSITGFNLLYYKAARIIELRDGIGKAASRTLLNHGDATDVYDLLAEATLHPERKLSDRWTRQGLQVIFAHPFLQLRVMTESAVILFVGPADAEIASLVYLEKLKSGPLGDIRRMSAKAVFTKYLCDYRWHLAIFLLSLTGMLGTYVGVALCFVSLVMKRTCPPSAFVLMFALVLYLVVASAGPEACARFRMPLMPVLGVLAAIGYGSCLRSGLRTCMAGTEPAATDTVAATLPGAAGGFPKPFPGER